MKYLITIFFSLIVFCKASYSQVKYLGLNKKQVDSTLIANGFSLMFKDGKTTDKKYVTSTYKKPGYNITMCYYDPSGICVQYAEMWSPDKEKEAKKLLNDSFVKQDDGSWISNDKKFTATTLENKDIIAVKYQIAGTSL